MRISGVAVYAWGRGDEGQLGVGDESDHPSPTPISAFAGKDIVHVAAGEYHTAFLTDEGEVYTTGNNDYGQLGARGQGKHVVPMRVAALDTHIVTHIACGSTHTVAVTETGALASWGGAEFGQLGFEGGSMVDGVQPRIVKGSRDLHFARVAAGVAHTLALTGSGDVYSFGQGSNGALGHGNLDSCSTPSIVKSLWSLGITQVACGEYHSVALTVDGQIFTWGRGKYGQLGHGTSQNGNFPVAVKALADHHVAQIACGGDHTIAVNSNGQIFSWGRGLWGQTGHGTKEDMLSPKQVQGLEGKLVVQATAGARHSVVLLDNGEVYGWGDCEQGQLGTSVSDTQLSPKLLLSFEDGKRPLFVVAGGEHTLIVCEKVLEDLDTPLSESLGGSVLISGTRVKVVDNRHGHGLRPMKMPSLLHLVQNAAASPRGLPVLAHALEDIFSSVKFLTVAFTQPASRNMDEENNKIAGRIRNEGEDVEGPELDVELVHSIYYGVLQLHNPEMVQKLGEAMLRLFQNVEMYMDTVPESRWTKVLLIGLQSPLIGEKGLGDTISIRLFAVFLRISASAEKKISQWLRTYPKEIFGGRFVRGIQRFISNRENHLTSGRDRIAQDIVTALQVLLLLYRADNNEDLIPFSEFYSTSISDHASLEDDYLRWSQVAYPKEAPLVAFCQLPFVLTPDAKSKILQIEATIQKSKQFQLSIMAQLLGAVLESPFLVLTIRRSNLIADSLRQLVEHECDFKKPLKVIFEGEAGVDEGGVTKEFFQLLIRELFNVSYGMFVYNEETRRFWFNRNSMETEHEFRLMGNILGLAIYNGVILDIHFPMAVYKKLMREPVSLKDLRDLQPQVAKGLEELLVYEGDVESTYCQTFQVTYEYFGEMKTHDLVEGGDIPVTNDNRERYVDLYVKYLLEDSIHEQFDAFYDGFYQVCGGPALGLFRHEELELLICGLPHFDFDALERVTVYQNGYTKDSTIIKWFWEVVKSMSLDEKKQLLFFTTGNDRAPVGGLATLKFIITRNGDDTDRLPTAHTCFNVLMLPNYSSKEKFENRLKLAIANSTGFGLQ
ncbi:hypothetical protein KC19_5G006600 [Ceratodon purpureus]|uniref:HECT domain-containing protein n=1 Tax=Ceratodon purpureus TaxID=3225 RepID=A0A8T0HXG8_CERPU|nr:hypothetical protein KC19_5G006600 [Ceratodon purpureus]